MVGKYDVGQIIKYKEGSNLRFGLIISKPTKTSYITASVETKSDYNDIDFFFEILADDMIAGILNEPLIAKIDEIKTIKRAEIVETVGLLKPQKIGLILKYWGKMLAKTYYETIHVPMQSHFPTDKIKINYGGRVFNEQEISNLVDSALDFWLTAGKYAQAFEHKFAQFLGVKYCSLVNSGSSANLLAFMTLTSSKLGGRKINRGDEIITVAASFPTTVSPIIQYGAIPVFVDITLPTYNIDCSMLEKAISPKTKALMLADTMGNPFDIEKVKAFCEKYNL
ncbi:lipopolysaccharide biosynthesis protein RfbH [Thermodesulfovibrio yellowstonii DSM 11347]|jgi:CDP-6-deoxy-D-xylo-4-hexulose-3-dehydrase|uniref:Lipopolysaccharide biosynthesis protein RfbH n=1 Tax=Thermodesulfovibrio yellowstonii (strain ATCC 51303 / DSM 11347 / YP87) TaxID=289376 RepID=B5YGB2_THEYD|nr:DegT/DnrJ/EryC1/StrS family aminotransferase [Thermodesulfovibrio yellowstonii]ACI21200.1 lipopolysaccharide biosynthesis protein RfbH [Thermodesulfovibrio yellowstonii DSM 11347]